MHLLFHTSVHSPLLAIIALSSFLLPSVTTFVIRSPLPRPFSPVHSPVKVPHLYTSPQKFTNNFNNPPFATSSSSSSYSSYTVPELKAMLRSLNLKVSGNKSTLISRLTDHASDSRPADSSQVKPQVDLINDSKIPQNLKETTFTNVASYVDADVSPEADSSRSLDTEFEPSSSSRLVDNLYRTTLKIDSFEYDLIATKDSLQPYLSGGSSYSSISDDPITLSSSEVKSVLLVGPSSPSLLTEITLETSPSIIVHVPSIKSSSNLIDIFEYLDKEYGTVGKCIWLTETIDIKLPDINVLINWRIPSKKMTNCKTITLHEEDERKGDEEHMKVKWEEGSGMLLASAWCNTWGRVFLRTR
ncbi:hypothetical protein TrST_g4967 [Triparma strigata]|uniref:SAP domain-containing protein n=2 Tax=Triparma strigata TaxID=1606541 RepID=A0A9W7A802_9STRA|nr:hypothetical protein TrST_g4967 [Triparma strigata]